MTAAPTFFNNYEAVAASGIGGFDDYVLVDVLPVELDPDLSATYAQGSIEVPITLTYVDTGVTTRLNMICRGYTDTPSKRLYVDSLYGSGTAESCTVVCTLNRATLASFQSNRMASAPTYSGWDAVSVDVGVNTYCNIAVASTITLENGVVPGDGLADYQQFVVGLGTTRILFEDAMANQPAITWNDTTTPGIIWEAGSAPQFQVGKTHMLVTIVGGTYGSVQHFA